MNFSFYNWLMRKQYREEDAIKDSKEYLGLPRWLNPHLPPDIVTISRVDYDKLIANQRKEGRKAGKAKTTVNNCAFVEETRKLYMQGLKDYTTFNAQAPKEENNV